MLSPARRRQCVDHFQAELGISERRACAVAGQHRSTQRKRPRGRDDEEALTAAIIRLASQYGRYGYRRITALLRTEGWHVNAKRVQRIWWREGLKVPQKQPSARPGSQVGAGCGSTTDPASVCGRAGPITSGPMTSSWIEHTMGGTLPIRLTRAMTATCRVPPLSRVKLGIWLEQRCRPRCRAMSGRR